MANTNSNVSVKDAAATVDTATMADFLDDVNPSGDIVPVADTTVTTPTVPPTVEPPVVVTPVTPVTDSAPATPVVPVVVTPTVAVDPMQAQLDALSQQNAKLVAMIDKLSGGTVTPTTVTPSTPVAVPETVTLDAMLESLDFDSIMESKENFGKFLKDALETVKRDAIKTFQEGLPGVVGTQVTQQMSMQELARSFYDTHKELSGVKKFVSNVANEVAAANPDWEIGKVLEESAKIAKDSLGIVSPTIPTNNDTNTITNKIAKPALPGGTQSGTRPTVGDKDEIMDLLDD